MGCCDRGWGTRALCVLPSLFDVFVRDPAGFRQGYKANVRAELLFFVFRFFLVLSVASGVNVKCVDQILCMCRQWKERYTRGTSLARGGYIEAVVAAVVGCPAWTVCVYDKNGVLLARTRRQEKPRSLGSTTFVGMIHRQVDPAFLLF